MTSRFLTDSMTAQYDVDPITGFVPRRPPLSRLPGLWEEWEQVFRRAVDSRLLPADTLSLSKADEKRSAEWRDSLQKMSLISVEGLVSPELLQRAHLVLTCLLAFFVQTTPTSDPISIPRTLSIPLLRVSKALDMPPILTYADTVLYNWYQPSTAGPDDIPAIPTLQERGLFTESKDEEAFYIGSGRIELRGGEALHLICNIIDDMALGDARAIENIANGLRTMALIINELRQYLLGIREGCDAEGYYHVVRPWYRGEDSDITKRKWFFEGLEDQADLEHPTELSGPSAGQSSVVHVLDAFLGIDTRSSKDDGKPSFMSRMRKYMPAKHRAFLDLLAAHPRPLREFVAQSDSQELRNAFNAAVQALKEFRDSHLIIVATYIIGPARRAEKRRAIVPPDPPRPLLGTGGSELMSFLKDLRAITANSLLINDQRAGTVE
ncbi:Indoleamine 2,3-dioxygenase [Flagelloscypha sp. PMI_526]|nr:Indoleamine 2,3-dioxygenase [Flagelloscypha sp. PMI_526]